MKKSPDPYSWLDEDDPRRNMTDEEILYKYIDFSKSHLTNKEKKGNGSHSYLQESF